MFQNVFNSAAVIAISTTAAVLVALAIAGNGPGPMRAVEPDLFQVTVIHKNQLHPRLGEVEARAAEQRTEDEANSVHGIVPGPQGQWI
jgi:hypothetical protein